MNSDAQTLDPNELRPMLHEKINTLDADGLLIMHCVLQQLEVEELAAQIQNEFAGERDIARRVDRAIAKFRKAHPYK